MRMFLPLGALASMAVFLGSCTVESGEPLPPRPDRPQICTREYAPVCAVRGDRRRTFSNACMARGEGFRPVHPGECRADAPPQSDRPQACTMQYDPVCARRGGSVRTFGNACQARVEGYQVIAPGEC